MQFKSTNRPSGSRARRHRVRAPERPLRLGFEQFEERTLLSAVPPIADGATGAWIATPSPTIAQLPALFQSAAVPSGSATAAVEPTADLQITMTAPATVKPGADMTYTITLTNNGPDPAKDVSWLDDLPFATALRSVSQVSGPDAFTVSTFADQVFETATNDIASGSQDTFKVVATANSDDSDGFVISNVADAFISTADPDLSNNSSSADTIVQEPTADLQIMSSSINPSVVGQNVTFTATVSAVNPADGTPSGTVQFVIDGSGFGFPVPLSAGSATINDAALSVGNHTVSANYSGDASFATSSGTLAGGQIVNPGASSTTIAPSTNPSLYGQTVTFTVHFAAVSPASGVPGGTVQFVIDGNNFGAPVPLSAGSSTINDAALSVGNHTVSANYSGDASFATSNGSLAGGQVVSPGASSTTIAPSTNPSLYGQTVTFTVHVAAVSPASGVPGGLVTFKEGSTVLGTGTLSGGVASFSTSSLLLGNHAISATYGGDAGFTSSGTSVLQLVDPVAGPAVSHGQSAGIGFWHNRNGQALIGSFNGGASSTALGNWLASTFANLYGANAGSRDLTGKTNAQVAAFYQMLFGQSGPKTDAQLLSTALSVYATVQSLGGSVGTAYGFHVSANGLAGATWNIGSNGSLFGVPNKSTQTVFTLLRSANAAAVNGVLYGGNSKLISQISGVFSAINEAGDIS